MAAETANGTSAPRFEVLSSNIVFLPVKLTVGGPDMFKSLQSSALVKLLGRGASISQGLAADVERGPVATIVVGGVQGQKQATFSSIRMDATDRSGSTDIDKNGLLAVATALTEFTGVAEIRAVGVNFEVVLDSPSGETAGAFIARKLIAELARAMPGQSNTDALGARLVFSADNGHQSTVSVESRFNDPANSEVAISLNTNSNQSHLPTIDELKALYCEGTTLLTSFLAYLEQSDDAPRLPAD